MPKTNTYSRDGGLGVGYHLSLKIGVWPLVSNSGDFSLSWILGKKKGSQRPALEA